MSFSHYISRALLLFSVWELRNIPLFTIIAFNFIHLSVHLWPLVFLSHGAALPVDCDPSPSGLDKVP